MFGLGLIPILEGGRGGNDAEVVIANDVLGAASPSR